MFLIPKLCPSSSPPPFPVKQFSLLSTSSPSVAHHPSQTHTQTYPMNPLLLLGDTTKVWMYLHLRLFNTNHTQPPAQRPAPRHGAASGTPAAHNYCGMPIPQLPATASQNSLNIQPHRQHPHPRQPAATTPTTPTKQQCRHTSHTHFTIFPRNINRAAFSEAEVFQGGKKR